MNALQDFVESGQLPFIGRRREIERLLAFADGAVEKGGLRSALIKGEAGAGKSRLIEELSGRLQTNRHVVIHVRFVREANLAPVGLLRRAVERADLPYGLLAARVGESTGAIIDAVHRLSRLRPTIIILEDLEYLPRGSFAALSAIFESLLDESLPILVATRPVEFEARGIFERYLVDEIELKPLEADDIDELWSKLLTNSPAQSLSETLLRTTRGNLLAIRSALRGALSSGTIAVSPAGELLLHAEQQALEAVFLRSIDVVARGLTAHLSEEELRAACDLAALGEQFSREAATALLGDRSLLDRLVLLGVIAPTTTGLLPLNSSGSSSLPYLFTHSLIHEHLQERSGVDPHRLLDLVASAMPLYTVLPFQVLLDRAGGISAPQNAIIQAIRESLRVARVIDRTPAWRQRTVPWGAATALISRFAAEWDDATCKEMQILLIRFDLYLHDRNPVDRRQLVEKILAVTRGERDREFCETRLAALGHLLDVSDAYDDVVLTDADDLLGRHPSLYGQESHCYFLETAMAAAVVREQRSLIDDIERRIQDVLSRYGLDADVRRRLLESVMRTVSFFENEGELEDRLALLGRLEVEAPWGIERLEVERATLYLKIGRAEQAFAAAQMGERFAAVRMLPEIELRMRVTQAVSRGLVDADPAGAVKSITALIERVEEGRSERLRSWAEANLRDLKGLASAESGELRRSDQILPQPILTLEHASIAASIADDTAVARRTRKLAARSVLDWLLHPDRNLGALATNRFESWRALVAKDGPESRVRSDSESKREERAEDRILVSLLGTASIRFPDGSRQRVSGLRMKTMLGLMTAQEVARERLPFEDFCRIAAGTLVYDKAARVAMNGIVWRLRDVIGAEGIDTTEETPRLNLEFVAVDFLEADRLIQQAAQARSAANLLRGAELLRKSLAIIDGRIPLPGLYDEYFDAVRSDFEERLQSVGFRIASEIAEAGDHEGAIGILSMLQKLLPGAEEIVELLVDLLERRGQRADAEAIRLAAAS